MLHKLHIQMTFFCTIVTGTILLFLTFICLFFAEKSLKNTENASFMRQLNSILLQLQEQDVVSHQWLNQIQKDGEIILYLYDHQNPLFYQTYHASREEETLQKEVIHTARISHQMDIFADNHKQIMSHTEFDFTASGGEKYCVSAGIIPRNHQQMSFLILHPLGKQGREIVRLRLVICLADLAAMLALFLFSWFFTRRMMIPVADSRRRQMDFIASASHELRAPLSVIRAGLEVVGQTEQPEERQHFLDYMREESDRMQNLIRDMLLLANADSGHLPLHWENCQPEELLISVYEKYEPIAWKKQIKLSISLPEECISDCFCDREKMTQVFSVLLDNAIAYTPQGGSIKLSLVGRKQDICFSVLDTGPGIAEEEKAHIFERFHRVDQAHSDRSHFGLGLCIAWEIVQEHQGKIRVEDAPGGGSCFVVELPVSNR